ncbi:hypothetical protein [Chthonobacter rhizosphaerae]|uniref:hypothetical protein n=1 Tax=Chthonobacter rhizosphaerae TaxID=2735553 RepID=UPI001AEE9709|nr:hypothetical protein [Chthonobacter rhizosphaerae]
MAFVKEKPDEARAFLPGYTSIEPDLVDKVPLAGYVLAKDFTEKDLGYFQTFFDLFTEKGVFPAKVDVPSLILKS